MKLARLVFPERSRDFRGKRWLKISLRTLHLIGMAGIAAFFLGEGIVENWLLFLHFTIFSGIGMMLIDTWSNGIYLIQLRGIATLIKIALFSWLLLVGEHSSVILISIIIISGLIAHAPGSVRYYSIFHRRRLDSLHQDKQPTEASHKCYFD